MSVLPVKGIRNKEDAECLCGASTEWMICNGFIKCTKPLCGREYISPFTGKSFNKLRRFLRKKED